MSLTSRIQALTAYANEVTGASDTTLSDAVATLTDGYGQGGGGSTITVDSALSSTSENPVQNKVIKVALDTKQDIQMMGKAVFVGDSVVQGYNNNNYSFVDTLEEDGFFESVTKNAVAGTTTSTMYGRLTEISTAVAEADIIYAGYENNDVVGLISGSLTTSDLVTALRNSVTYIRNLNSDALIVWLPLTIYHFDKISTQYASYFKTWANAMYPVFAELGINLLPMYDTLYTSAHAVSDGKHPNNAGHRVIANLIKQNPYGYSNYLTSIT